MTRLNKSGSYRLGHHVVNRLGYGAMQLAGLACSARRKIVLQHWPSFVKRLPAV
jgi:hypothetical protein